MRTSTSVRLAETLTTGALAGMAGGLAEIGWIVVYGATTGTPVGPVARGVVRSAIPALAASTSSAGLGVLIHLGLAVALGIVLALALRLAGHRLGAGHSSSGFVVLALAAVWTVNFLVALPHINPAFVHLLPYGVTLLSKLLFGFSAAMVFKVSGATNVRP